MSFMDFSSWPREQEQQFVVYEQRAAEAQSKAFTVGIISGVTFLVIAVGIFFGVAPDEKDLTKGMNMENLTKSSSRSAAPAPTPDPPKAEAAPAAEAESEAAPAEEDKEE